MTQKLVEDTVWLHVYRSVHKIMWWYLCLYFIIQVLSSVNILNNYESRLVNAVPVVSSAHVIVQENGESGDHSLDPLFYDSPIANSGVYGTYIYYCENVF